MGKQTIYNWAVPINNFPGSVSNYKPVCSFSIVQSLSSSRGMFTYDVSQKYRGVDPPFPPCQKTYFAAVKFYLKQNTLLHKKIQMRN